MPRQLKQCNTNGQTNIISYFFNPVLLWLSHVGDESHNFYNIVCFPQIWNIFLDILLLPAKVGQRLLQNRNIVEPQFKILEKMAW